MSTIQKYWVSTLKLANMIGLCYTLMYVELSTCVIVGLTLHIPIAEKSLLIRHTFRLFYYRVFDIPTLHLDNIIGYGVVL